MQKQINFNTQRFAVIGIGDTGLSIINYLKLCQANIVKILDTRDNPPNQQFISDIPLVCGALKHDEFDNIDVVVISPGISIYNEILQKIRQSGVLVVGDIELFALAIQSWNCKIIGITGSNGKTTVTALTGYIAQSLGIKTLIAGNIGTPVLNSFVEIAKTKEFPELIVLELSSFQLETVYSLKLDSATVLNISEDHLDRYRDLLEYAYTKANIFNQCTVQVLNSQDVLVMGMKRQNMTAIEFGMANAEFSLSQDNGSQYITINGEKILDCRKLQIVGMHNYLNTLASLALLDGAKINIMDAQLIDILIRFKGLEHRMQKILEYNGVVFIEDSKGTNVGAVVAGISGLDGYVHLILGGDGKGQDFKPLRNLVESKCKSVAVIGQDKMAILEVLNGISIPIGNCVTLEEAVDFCYSHARYGDNVVLSPACASWDMFKDYKHRANVFVNYVNLLVE